MYNAEKLARMMQNLDRPPKGTHVWSSVLVWDTAGKKTWAQSPGVSFKWSGWDGTGHQWEKIVYDK